MKTIRRNIAAAVLAAFTLTGAMPILADDIARVPSSNRLDFLAGYLTLTDAQKTQAKTIFDAATTAATTAQGQLTAAHDALTAAVKTNRADSELDRLAAAIGVIHGQLEAIHAKAMAKFYALLTAEQKTKYDTINSRTGPGGGRGGLR
jgi:Spy/CpxP family protein refolding chaperone